jgi:ribonucleoside-diphosphate reductase alpha chain
MKVVKRNGKTNEMELDQITDRIKRISDVKSYGPKLDIDPIYISKEVCSLLYDGITTSELDEFTASISANMILKNPDYEILASRIIINNHIKNTSGVFSESIIALHSYGLISDTILNIVKVNKEFLDGIIVEDRDYSLSYFGFKTLEKSYLLKTDKVIERPQGLFLRVALGIHFDNLEKVKETYDDISLKYYTHATPTLFSACTRYPQMSSCFLIGTEDSVEGIFKTISDVGLISKWAGGIGVHISNIRANDSYISSTGGKSSGIMPMLKVYNDVARYINQTGKRNGSFAMYLEPWHADVFSFLDAKKNNGAEELRARDLFYGLWVPDLFMKRVKNSEKWSLMCPNQCPGLTDVHSEEFEILYEKYEQESRYVQQVDAEELWKAIINSQIETGSPYILYKDSCNRKSNQKNLGTIKSSNLCCEIVEYSDNKETAVCNLASICLPMYIKDGNFDYVLLYEKTKKIVVNLNSIIDKNNYPTPESKKSNNRHRPIGIGVQGLADVFMILEIPFESEKAKIINKNIFETIYFSALESSVEESKIHGPYETFNGSPASRGILQFDLWNVTPEKISIDKWNILKGNIRKHGLRNSLLVAPMPTASTAHIMGNNESFEPYTSNLYTRRVLAGEFILINRHLYTSLKNKGIWSDKLIKDLIISKGSVQNLDIPEDTKMIFKTAWEISQKCILDMSIDRGPYICQSQSLNLFVDNADANIIHSIHFYGWSRGLKTGSYYIRTKPILSSQNFTIEPDTGGSESKSRESDSPKVMVCTDEVCTMCSA